MRLNAPERLGFEATYLRSGPLARLARARVDSQSPLSRGHLRSGDPARRGGRRLMHAYWTLIRRELSGYFFSMTGYVIIAAAMLLLGFSFVDLLKQLQHDPTS